MKNAFNLFTIQLLVVWVFLILGLYMTPVLAQSNPDDILGEWVSENKDSKIDIYRLDDQYFGKITWGTGGDTLDTKNPNPAFHSRPLVGLVILKNFTFEPPNVWKNGTIYDPRDGNTYDCKMTLRTSETLSIRGYVGFSLFGRTENWKRNTEEID